MKASELRIGNYINLIGSRQGIVLEVRTNHARIKYELEGKEKQSHVEYENLEPIPLTEEWLLRLGGIFWHNEGKHSQWQIGHTVLIFGNLKDGFRLLDGSDQTNWSKVYKHVHEIQNLYFALCGEELEANP